MMPEMDGVETAHKIRAKAGIYYQNVPIVALTANAIGGAREMFLEEGFQEYVAKPIEMSHLERVLRKYIPDEKIIRMDDASNPYEEVESTTEPEENLRLNRQRGIQYCGGNEDDYKEILQVYLNSGLQKIREIRERYKAEDWKNYTILVHALKSTSIGIGATTLGEMAKELEMVAGDAVAAAYSRENLSRVIVAAVENWSKAPEAEDLTVILNSRELAQLEEGLMAALKEKMLQGVTLKASDSFDGGFRIAVQGGSAYYDYSAEAVVDLLSGYLSPRVTQLLKEAQ
jgi:CheY-like chemotaxis protein